MQDSCHTMMIEKLDSKTVIRLSTDDVKFFVTHERFAQRRGWFEISRKTFDDKNEAHCYLIDICNSLAD